VPVRGKDNLATAFQYNVNIKVDKQMCLAILCHKDWLPSETLHHSQDAKITKMLHGQMTENTDVP